MGGTDHPITIDLACSPHGRVDGDGMIRQADGVRTHPKEALCVEITMELDRVRATVLCAEDGRQEDQQCRHVAVARGIPVMVFGVT